jgi:hypothetical protein
VRRTDDTLDVTIPNPRQVDVLKFRQRLLDSLSDRTDIKEETEEVQVVQSIQD